MKDFRGVENVLGMSDEDAAKGIVTIIGLYGLLGETPENVVQVVSRMINDVRAAERFRIERGAVGAKVAAECLKETP